MENQNKSATLPSGLLIGVPVGADLVESIFGKHFPGFPGQEGDEAKPVDFSAHGVTADEWNSVPHTVTAIQYQPENLGAVLAFMHKNSIPFGSCKHGTVLFLVEGEEEPIVLGDWIVVRRFEDGATDSGIYGDKEFTAEYGRAKKSDKPVKEEDDWTSGRLLNTEDGL